MFLNRTTTEKEKAPSNRRQPNFFGNQPAAAPFFSPVVQKQPAAAGTAKQVTVDDLLQEAQGTAQELEQMQQQIHQTVCDLFTTSIQAVTNTNEPINKDTAALLDIFATYAATCSSISKYIKSKPAPILGKHYKTYAHYRGNDFYTRRDTGRFDSDAWHKAVKAYLGTPDREEIRKVGGFYNRKNDTINLPADSTFGNALHESVHRLSAAPFMTFFGSHLNEGLTQYFTNLLLREAGYARETTSNYGGNLRDIQLLVAKLPGGHDLLAKAYFSADIDAIKQIFIAINLPQGAALASRLPPQKILEAIKKP